MAYREIFESPEFTAELEKLGAQHLDECLRGLTFELWIDAEDFPLVDPNHRLRVATLTTYTEKPEVTVYFEIDSDKVILRWIEILAG